MERDRSEMPKAEEMEEEDMDTSGHGDKLQDAVNKVADSPGKQDEDAEKGDKEKDRSAGGQGNR